MNASVPTPRGRRIAVDVGSVRIGVAVCDPDGLLATPVETVARRDDGSDIARVAAIAAEYDVVDVIVGLPSTLRGEHGRAAQLATAFADQLRPALADSGVIMHDERFSTTVASQMMHASGRNAKKQRAVIDQAAAVAILQSWLDRYMRSSSAVSEDLR